MIHLTTRPLFKFLLTTFSHSHLICDYIPLSGKKNPESFHKIPTYDLCKNIIIYQRIRIQFCSKMKMKKLLNAKFKVQNHQNS